LQRDATEIASIERDALDRVTSRTKDLGGAMGIFETVATDTRPDSFSATGAVNPFHPKSQEQSHA
jgi:hypothetical protein